MFLETMKNIALERGGVRCVLYYSGEDKYALGISDGTNTPLVINGTFEELQAKLDSEMPEFLEKIRKEVQEKKAKEEQNRREAEIKAAEEKLRREELAKKPPSKSLLSLVSKLKDKEIEFESNEQFHTAIKCGNADFFLLGIDPKEFPELFEFEPEQKVCIQQSDLVKMIDAVSYACSYDDSRKILKGICFTGKDGVFAAVATDSKRLAVIEKTPEEMPEDLFNFVLPLKTAIETKRLLGSDGTVTLELNSKMIRIDLGNTVLMSKLLEGSYPNYQNIIPASFKNEVVLQKKEMIESLDLVGIPLTEANGSVTLKFGSEEMELFAQSTAVGEGRDKLMLPYQGEPFQVVFNLSYLLAPFKYFHGDALTMKINDPASPVMLTNGDFLYIVMPIRAK